MLVKAVLWEYNNSQQNEYVLLKYSVSFRITNYSLLQFSSIQKYFFLTAVRLYQSKLQ